MRSCNLQLVNSVSFQDFKNIILNFWIFYVYSATVMINLYVSKLLK
jgi:hypothetical protein